MARTRLGATTQANPTAARTLQLILSAFFLLAIAFLVTLYAIAPQIYVGMLGGETNLSDSHPFPLTIFLAGVVTFIAIGEIGEIGVLRRWRWVFWLILVAFTFSALQIPATILELAGILPVRIPAWYGIARLVVATVLIGIASYMLRIYCHYGVWAEGRRDTREDMS